MFKLSHRDDLSSFISDAHKDAYGFRPRHYNMAEMPMAELEALADDMVCAVARAVAEENDREAAVRAAFEAGVAKVRAMGAGDRETAVRWLVEAENFDDYDRAYGAVFVNYLMGVGYDYDLLTGKVMPNRNFDYSSIGVM